MWVGGATEVPDSGGHMHEGFKGWDGFILLYQTSVMTRNAAGGPTCHCR